MKTDPMEKCTNCGATLPEDAPQGLCPLCLLKGGLRSGPFHNFTPPPPEELARHFPQMEILGLLGRGGMGVVYKARQRHLDRIVALKILPADTQGDPAFAERFSREARALAKLSHPNIVAVHEFGESEGLFYFVMEYVDGVNLRQSMNARRISAAEALAIVPQVCDALQYAHDKGIVHRDIKPENILLDKAGRAKIADFGLAKILAAESTDLTLTQVGQAMGTTHYMAPEQLEHPEDVDHRADIYSLGVVFYQMLTGELPIGRFAAPSRKVQIDVRLDEIVLRTLEKEPELRYPQAGELKTDISHVVDTPKEAPTPRKVAPEAPRAPRVAKSSWRWIALGLTPVLGFALGEALGPPKQYKAAVTLELKPGDFGPRDPRVFNVVMSKEVLDPVIDSLQLRQRWAPETGMEVFLKLRGELSVSEVRDTKLVQIVAIDSDPKLAADIANAVAEEWRKRTNEARKESAEQDLAALQGEIEKQRKKVDASQEEVARIVEGMVPNAGIEPLQIAYEQAEAEEKRLMASGLGASHPTIKGLSAKMEVMARQIKERSSAKANGAADGANRKMPQDNLEYDRAQAEYVQARRALQLAKIRLDEAQVKSSVAEAPLVIREKAETPSEVAVFSIWPTLGTVAGLLVGILLFFVGSHFLALSAIMLLCLAGLCLWPLAWAKPIASPAIKPTAPPEVKPASDPARITVSGDVRVPVRLDYSPDLTVAGAITATGGFTEYADQKRVRLIRAGKVQIIDLTAILKQPSLDVLLQPGDSIEVPKTFW